MAYNTVRLYRFMLNELGEVGQALGEGQGLNLEEALEETLLLYSVSTVEEATDLLKLRAIARWQAWRAAVASLAARYDFTNPEGSYHRNQMLEAAQRRLADAEFQATPFLVGPGWNVATVMSVSRLRDPYVPQDAS